jgi:hypothetical protein
MFSSISLQDFFNVARQTGSIFRNRSGSMSNSLGLSAATAEKKYEGNLKLRRWVELLQQEHRPQISQVPLQDSRCTFVFFVDNSYQPGMKALLRHMWTNALDMDY